MAKPTIDDVLTGKAFIRLPPDAKLKLLERFGAPWNEQDPTSTLVAHQVEVLTRPDRVKIVNGGTGSGKSVIAAGEALCELVLPHSRLALVGPSYELAGIEFKYVHDAFLNYFGSAAATRISNVNTLRAHDMEISTIWGSSCKVYSTMKEDGEALLGKEFDLIILGEGSRVSIQAYEKYLWRAVARRRKRTREGYIRNTGRFVIYTTPDGYGGPAALIWQKVMKETAGNYERRMFPVTSWKDSVFLMKVPSTANPAFDKEEFEKARRDLPDDVFREQYLGEMTQKTGLIYKEFDEEKHVQALPPDELIRKMRLGIGMDTGQFTAATIVGYTPDQTMWVLGEVFTHEYDIKETCDELKQKVVSILGPAFEIPTDNYLVAFESLKDRIDVLAIDNASQHFQEVSNAMDIVPYKCKQDKLPGIDAIRGLLRTEKMFLSTDIMVMVEEMNKYTWKLNLTDFAIKGKPGTKAVQAKGTCHVLDATRYVINALIQMGPPEPEEAKMDWNESWKQKEKFEVFGHLLLKNHPEYENGPDAYAEWKVWNNNV